MLEIGLSGPDLLQELGYAVDWRSYPMQHQVCPAQIADIAAWLGARLRD